MTSTSENGGTAASPDYDATFQFLQTQISYVTSHLQIADGKASGVIAYISVLSGYAATKLTLPDALPYGLAVWLGLVGSGLGLLALVSAFLAVKPRAWPGRDPKDPFSWVGLSAAASEDPYPNRVLRLTAEEMHRGLADAVETCSRIVTRKYQLVTAAVLGAMVSTLMQITSWIVR